MARVEGEIIIHRPTEVVFDFVADERNERLYNPRMLTAVQASGATRMRWSWDVQSRGVLRMIRPVVGLVGRRQERTIEGNLKRLLESDAHPGQQSRLGR
jgi:hypothetical protein